MDKLINLGVDIVNVDFAELQVNNHIPEIFKSDFLRWHVLSTAGGLWSDFDIIYFKPITYLHLNQKGNEDINTVICFNEKPAYHSIGFLMSAPNNQFYRFIYEKAVSGLDLQEYQSIGYNLLNTQFPDLETIRNAFDAVKLGNLKMEVVYPLNHNHIPLIFTGNYFHLIDTDNSIGIHWYGGHPDAGRFENCVNENNYNTYDNVISQIIAKVI